MKSWVGRAAAILLGIVSAAAAAVAIAKIAFERRISGEIDALLASAKPGTRVIRANDLARLPEPVQRWLRYSNVTNARVPSRVRLRQEGQFRLEGRGWMPFSAEQYFTTEPPGFLWKATFRMAPAIWIAGRDRYQSGEGSIIMRVLSIVPVADKTGGGLNQGALLRYLGEMQWFPAAALSDFIAWEPVDGDSARATMSHGGISAAMTFRFAATGQLIEESAIRYNDSHGRNELWINDNDADAVFGGVRVPASGEARWQYESGPFPYIRWRVTTVEQDRAMRFGG